MGSRALRSINSASTKRNVTIALKQLLTHSTRRLFRRSTKTPAGPPSKTAGKLKLIIARPIKVVEWVVFSIRNQEGIIRGVKNRHRDQLSEPEAQEVPLLEQCQKAFALPR